MLYSSNSYHQLRVFKVLHIRLSSSQQSVWTVCPFSSSASPDPLLLWIPICADWREARRCWLRMPVWNSKYLEVRVSSVYVVQFSLPLRPNTTYPSFDPFFKSKWKFSWQKTLSSKFPFWSKRVVKGVRLDGSNANLNQTSTHPLPVLVTSSKALFNYYQGKLNF